MVCLIQYIPVINSVCCINVIYTVTLLSQQFLVHTKEYSVVVTRECSSTKNHYSLKTCFS